MAETKNLLYTLKIEGTDTELDKLAKIRSNIKGLEADVKDFSKTDEKQAELSKLNLQQQRKEYQELQKQITNRNKAEKDSVKTLESMRAELSNLNKTLERIPVGTKAFEDQQKKAKILRDEINGIDQASGKWQGNVGNYKNAIVDAFQVMGINVSGFTDKLDKVGDLLKSATSSASTLAGAEEVLAVATTETTAATGGLVVAQRAQTTSSTLAAAASNVLSVALRVLKIALISTGIGAIVVALGALVAYFTGAQDGADKLTKALLPFKKILGELVEFAETLGGALVKIFTGDFTQGIKDAGSAFGDLGGNIKQAVKDATALYDLQIKLREASLAVLSQEANINNQIAERIKILDDENNSMQERKKAAEEAVKWQDILTNLKKDEARIAIEQFKLENKNDLDLIENQRKLIELNNRLTELDTEGLQATKKIRNQLYAIQKKQSDEALAAIQLEREERHKSMLQQREMDQQTYDFLRESINSIKEIKDELKENGEDVIFKLIEEEDIDDIPNILQSLQDLAAEEVNLAKRTTEEIKGTYTQRLEALQAALNQGIITEEQYANRKREINGMIADDTIASLKGVAKEGTALSRGLFVFEKALAAKKALLAILEGTSQTAKVGFPQNIPLLIGFFAQVAGLIGAIKGVIAPEPPKFARGVIGIQGPGTSTSDSINAMISKDESVMTARATKVYAPVLAEMERSVGNRPNVQRYASGFIPTPVSGLSVDVGAQIRAAVQSVASIPVIVAEGEMSIVQSRVRRIKVAGDL